MHPTAESRHALYFREDAQGTSWLGGPSFTPSSLPHVATFSLSDAPSLPHLPLPTTGYLEVFHDGASTGAIVYTKGGKLYPAPNPFDAYQPGTLTACTAITSPNDLYHLSDEDFAAYDLAYSDWQGELVAARGLTGEFNSTMLGGFSSAGATTALTEYLPASPTGAPADSGADAFVLLAEIESWTTLEGWFGDSSPLEVWIRPSDLAAARFDRAHLIVRTD